MTRHTTCRETDSPLWKLQFIIYKWLILKPVLFSCCVCASVPPPTNPLFSHVVHVSRPLPLPILCCPCCGGVGGGLHCVCEKRVWYSVVALLFFTPPVSYGDLVWNDLSSYLLLLLPVFSKNLPFYDELVST